MTNDPSPHHTVPSSQDAGRLHDEQTEAADGAAVDGNIHVGYWDNAADDRSLDEATDRLTDRVAARLAAAPGRRLLDVGCGTGRPALRIARATGARVAGISVSNEDIDLARTRAHAAALADRVYFRYADACALPFDAASFDGAWAIESMMHILDRTAALTEIARTLRPGSPLVITDVLLRSPVTGDDAETVRRTCRAFGSPGFPNRRSSVRPSTTPVWRWWSSTTSESTSSAPTRRSPMPSPMSHPPPTTPITSSSTPRAHFPSSVRSRRSATSSWSPAVCEPSTRRSGARGGTTSPRQACGPAFVADGKRHRDQESGKSGRHVRPCNGRRWQERVSAQSEVRLEPFHAPSGQTETAAAAVRCRLRKPTPGRICSTP